VKVSGFKTCGNSITKAPLKSDRKDPAVEVGGIKGDAARLLWKQATPPFVVP
jgi:hypothetical protein